MITRDRPELTEQCIRSMRENAADWSRHRLVVVFDGSETEAQQAFAIHDLATVERIQAQVDRFGPLTLIYTGRQVGVGGAKNFGAQWYRNGLSGDASSRRPSPEGSGLLMFSDNDMWYGPGWDTRLETAMQDQPARGMFGQQHKDVTQLGGWRHPFHRIKWPDDYIADIIDVTGRATMGRLVATDAVTGNCFVMRWSDWLKYGPFDSNAIGPGQSEDYALSQRIRAGGGLVATLDPPVAIHCGLVNSVGEPATGWRECEKQITEQLAGLSTEMRDSVLIMRPVPELPQVSSAERIRQVLRGGSPFQQVFEEARERVGMQPREATARGTTLADINECWNRDVVERIAQRRDHPTYETRPLCLNIGSGQRRFESTPEAIWVNVDSQRVPPDRVPDVLCNVGVHQLPYVDSSAQYVVLHQVAEHFGCGESEPMLRECWRVLKRGGSLIITVPDMRKLAARWLGGEMDTQLFMTNVYGAYMGDEADRHKWGFDWVSLRDYLAEMLVPANNHCDSHTAVFPDCDLCVGDVVRPFNWRPIPGADIAGPDWWILAVEVIKP